jgi:hypothetical protein
MALPAFLETTQVLHFVTLYYFSFYVSRSLIYLTAAFKKQFRKVKSQKVTLISLWASIFLCNVTLKNNEGILAPCSSYINNKGIIKIKTHRSHGKTFAERSGGYETHAPEDHPKA